MSRLVDCCPWPGGLRPMKGLFVLACSGNEAYNLGQKKKKKRKEF